MIVADVMTQDVLSVLPDATVGEAASLMLQHRISGLLVVDPEGELAGVVTEGDLLRRNELGTQREQSWWRRLVTSPGRDAAEFTRTHGRKVRDVMTETVMSVPQDADLGTVVDLMERNHIKRVPVTQETRVVGVVSRSDLLRALVSHADVDAPAATDDYSIETAIVEALEKQSWAPATTLNVTVEDGVANLGGTITSEDERRAIGVVAENTAGVKSVRDRLVFVEPYSGTVIEAPDDKA